MLANSIKKIQKNVNFICILIHIFPATSQTVQLDRFPHF